MKIAHTPRPPAFHRGMTLVELLVAIVIAMVVVLAATNLVIVGEAHKRSTTSSNDSSQSGSYAAYVLDRAIRSAGSGFALSWDQGMFGCRLSAARVIGGAPTTILPRDSALPAPFAGFLGGAAGMADLRVAPILIGDAQGPNDSDVLMVMTGNSAAGDMPRPIRSGVVATNNLRLDNTVGMRAGDIGLITQPGTTDCLLEQVGTTDASFAAAGNDVLPLGGDYLNASTGLGTMAASGSAFFSVLGNRNVANSVQFQVLGVDDNRTLFAYDLLRSAGNGSDDAARQALADGVLEVQAMYGINTNVAQPVSSANPPSWVAPTGTWAIANVMANPALIRQIVAIRVAIVMRDSFYEKEPVSTGRPVLFAGTAGEIAATSYAATTDAAHFRIRVIDTTIPLRNMLLLGAS